MAQLYYSPFPVAAAQITGTLTDFTGVIRVTDARLKVTGSGGHVAGNSGFDIRPYSDAALTTALSFELVKYVDTTGELIMWVKVPSIATSTNVYLGYGDAALNTDGSTTAAWRTEYKGVWHGANLLDSTSSGFTLTAQGSGSSAGNAGTINTCFTFNGSGNYTAGDQAALDINGEITLSLWMKPNSGSDGYVLSKKGTNGWVILSSSTGANARIEVYKTGSSAQPAADMTGMNAAWHQFVGQTISGSNLVAQYKDGGASSSNASFTPGDMSNTADFLIANFAGFRFTGSVEEVRLYAGALSTAWITAEYNNQVAPTTFWPIGTEVAVGAGGSGSAFHYYGGINV